MNTLLKVAHANKQCSIPTDAVPNNIIYSMLQHHFSCLNTRGMYFCHYASCILKDLSQIMFTTAGAAELTQSCGGTIN